VARDVIAGRVTLLDAAAAFGALQDAVPGYSWDGFREMYAGASDDERLCRAVILYVAVTLADDPGLAGEAERAADLVRRLWEELDAHLRAGTLRLPTGGGTGGGGVG